MNFRLPAYTADSGRFDPFGRSAAMFGHDANSAFRSAGSTPEGHVVFGPGLNFTGTTEDDTQDGTVDDDTFDYSQGGNDTLNGLDGNDTFFMGTAFDTNDRIDGGAGFDIVYTSADGGLFGLNAMHNIELLVLSGEQDYSFTLTDDTVAAGQFLTIDASNLGSSSDHLFFDGSAETDGTIFIDGGEGADTLLANGDGSGATFTMYGGGGDDTLAGGSGADSLYGGDDNDSIGANNGGTYTVDGGEGDDTVYFAGAIDSSDQIEGGGGVDVLVLRGDVNLNIPTFDPASLTFESVLLDLADVAVTGDATANVIDFSTVPVSSPGGFALSILGADGDDTITGSELGDSIYGGEGNNTLSGLAGNDLVDVQSTTGDNTLHGGEDDDQLTALAATGTNTLNGDNGDDTLIGGLGETDMYGGEGDDTIGANNGGTYLVDAGNGDDLVYVSGILSSPGHIQGGAGTDIMALGNVPLVVNLPSFKPLLDGFEKVKLYQNGAEVNGDDNANIIDFFNVTVVGAHTRTLTFHGNGGDDSITGSNWGETIYGGTGENILAGVSGNDTLDVQDSVGTNILDGGDGDDDVTGGTGADTIFSGDGKDHLKGGDGDDAFIVFNYLTATDQIDGGAGNDTLYLNDGESALAEAAALAFNNKTVLNVETIRLASGGDYNITIHNATVARGHTLRVDGNDLSDNDTLVFDGSHETNGNLIIDGGEGGDTLTGGGGFNRLSGHSGKDVLFGGAGHSILKGGHGADQIFGNTGAYARIVAGAGDDEVSFAGTIVTPAQVRGGTGDDTLIITGNIDLHVANFNPATLGFEKVQIVNGLGTSRSVVGDGGDNTIDFSGVPVAINIGHFIIGGAGGNDTLTGSNIAETIYGGDGDNTLTGLDGNDTLDVHDSSGTNTLYGGRGADRLTAGSGDDTMYGGNGGDAFIGGTGHTTMYGGDGADFMQANLGGIYTIDAGDGNDEIDFTGTIFMVDQLLGGANTDTLILSHTINVNVPVFDPAALGFEKVQISNGLGADTTIHGDDSDTTIDFSGVQVAINIGHLILDGGDGNDTITGSNIGEFIFGGDGNNALAGLGGNDHLDAHLSSGTNTLYGGLGADTLTAADGTTTMYGGSGADTFYGGAGDATMYGGNGNDFFQANLGGTYIADAGDGTDEVDFTGTIFMAGQLLGGAGTDTLVLNGVIEVNVPNFDPEALGFEKVQISNGLGTSTTIHGDSSANTIDFSGVQMSININSFIIDGAGGDDSLTGGNLRDIIYGGAGDNALSGLGGNDNLDVHLSSGINTLYGGGNDDILTAGSGTDALYGGGNDDVFYGGTGHATMYGGDGNDFFQANLGGSYTVDAGDGNDEVDFEGTVSAPAQLVGGLGTDTLVLTGNVAVNTASFDLDALGFEHVTLENSVGTHVTLTGDGNANAIDFSGVAVTFDLPGFTIDGGGGNDTVGGSNIAETILGGSGDDTINAGGGADILIGGIGQDMLAGGAGADTYVFEAVGDSLASTGHPDFVDFSSAEHDIVDLGAIDADSTQGGDQAFHLGPLDRFTHTPGELIQVAKGGHTIVSGDVDGDGIADFEFDLTTMATLVDGDFVF